MNSYHLLCRHKTRLIGCLIFIKEKDDLKQQTLKYPTRLTGIGLHSGCTVTLNILPAAASSGIVFRRVDLPDKPLIPALYDKVYDTRNCTAISNNQGAVVSTIEHLMGAFYVAGIDNAIVEIDNQEVPIMDGSGKIFYDALTHAELEAQDEERHILRVVKAVDFTDDKGNHISLQPTDTEGLSVHFDIDFPSEVVGHQIFDDTISAPLFEHEIAPSRTFCEKYQVDYLRSLGLIKGGSLDNAVVLDGNTILNPEGFRVENECVKHKVLDAIGDLYTSGYRIQGRLEAAKTGHYHNNMLLHKLFADSTQYELL